MKHLLWFSDILISIVLTILELSNTAPNQGQSQHAKQNQQNSQHNQGSACNAMIVILSTCCANTHCCQGIGNGYTALNCNNAKLNSEVDVFGASKIMVQLLCNAQSCSVGSECVQIFNFSDGKMTNRTAKCCAAEKNGSFLCGNQVHCNQINNKGRNQEICCSGNCNQNTAVQVRANHTQSQPNPTNG